MAGGVVLGYLKYVLGFDSIQFKKGMTEAERELVLKQKSFIKQGEKLQSLGKSMAAFVTLPLAGLAAAGIKEATETAAAMGQVNAALASMGPVAGRTADQLKKAADAFEGSSLYEGDEILKKVTANMLTFGNIAGASFDRAQQAAINLSARMGTDLQSSALLVGKALNAPITGLSALTRVGIQFTEGEKAQIKAMTEAGNAAGAQQIILANLERQFGGSAQAAQDTDPYNKMTDAFKGMAEAVGTALLPIIPPLTDAITAVLGAFTSLSPETQKWVLIIGGSVAVLGPVVGIIGTLMATMAPLLPLILKLGPAWTALKAAFVAARIAALATLPALVPLLVPLAAIAAAVGVAYLAWKNWDKIKPIVQAMVTGVADWLRKLASPFNWVIDKLSVVGKAFFALYDKVVGHSYIPDMVTAIGEEMAKLDRLMVQPAKAATSAAAQAFQELQSRVAGILGQLYPEQAKENQLVRDLKDIDEYAKKAGWSLVQLWDAQDRLKNQSNGIGNEIGVITDGSDPLEFKTGVEEFLTANDNVAESAKMTGQEVIRAYGDMATGVIGSLRDMVSQFKHGDILSGLQTLLNMVTNVVDILGRTGVIHLGGAGATPRASGGPVVPGRRYLVGERGPEYVTFGSRGYVTPNKDVGGSSRAARVTVIPSPLFNAVVQGEAAKVAAPMSGQAAIAGAAGGMTGMSRRASRQLP